jgi:hypothetical protein
MNKAEKFDQARRLAYKGDFSLVEKLYDPDCKHFDHRGGIEVNLNMQHAVMSAYENSVFGPFRVIYENEEFLCVHRYVKWTQPNKKCLYEYTKTYKTDSSDNIYTNVDTSNAATENSAPFVFKRDIFGTQQEQGIKELIYWTMISGLNYKNGRIIRHETAFEELDYDPSDNQDWNWEDFE